MACMATSQTEKGRCRPFCSLEERRARYFQLMQRSITIGLLFPKPEDVDPDDPVAMAEVTVLLREFNKCNDEMEELVNGLPK
jgi:hypothetical protein